MKKITEDILQQIYTPRSKESHKYNYGLLLIIGGSEFYTGSPALSAMAAFRAGVDMVRVLAPKRAADIIASFSPNLAAYPLRGGWLDSDDISILVSMTKNAIEVANNKIAVVIGGGLGRSEETKEAVLSYLKETEIDIKGKLVIDADGIYAVAKNLNIIKNKNFVLTPHSYEFFVLTGQQLNKKTLEEKIEIVRAEAEKLGCVIVLKGSTDIISNGKEIIINETGSPFMTVGGCGDTLAGILGGILAQGVEPFLAAQAAAYINGKAGEKASEKWGPAMIATDLIAEIANVIKLS